MLTEQLKGFVQRKAADVVTKDLPSRQVFALSIRQTPLQMQLYRRYWATMAAAQCGGGPGQAAPSGRGGGTAASVPGGGSAYASGGQATQGPQQQQQQQQKKMQGGIFQHYTVSTKVAADLSSPPALSSDPANDVQADGRHMAQASAALQHPSVLAPLPLLAGAPAILCLGRVLPAYAVVFRQIWTHPRVLAMGARHPARKGAADGLADPGSGATLGGEAGAGREKSPGAEEGDGELEEDEDDLILQEDAHPRPGGASAQSALPGYTGLPAWLPHPSATHEGFERGSLLVLLFSLSLRALGAMLPAGTTKLSRSRSAPRSEGTGAEGPLLGQMKRNKSTSAGMSNSGPPTTTAGPAEVRAVPAPGHTCLS